MMLVLKLFVVLLCYRSASADTFVVTTDDPGHGGSSETNKTLAKPQMYYFNVESDVKFRYARTLVSTRIANPAEAAQEAYFSVVLPETAFISGFLMEVDGKVYKAYVKEKEEAKQVYEQAVQQGQTAAHVALTARNSNRFTVSVNLEPQKKVTFNLTYEELLGRKLGVYRDVINLDPEQIVPQFSVTVRIEESSNITTLKVPALKVNNEIEPNETNPLATIERPTSQSAVITFAPTPDQQRELAKDGIKGQFIVEYDVDRTSQAGEVLVNDGYFVHFFSPSDLTPLNKHVTFVLDLSGSMSGRKIEQLRQAMITILGNLNDGDYFSMVLFSDTAQVWDPTVSDEEMDRRLRAVGSNYLYSQDEMPAPVLTHSVIAKVTPENIKKAKSFVEKFTAIFSTNIYDGLLMAIGISKIDIPKTGEQKPETVEQKPEPIIVFLTDGLANGRVSDPNTIVNDVTKANTRNSSIFSLALGDDADFSFLKKLSLGNLGFTRKIYEAADTALQLTDFYREISSPLLAYVKFQYTPEEVENGTVTKHIFRRLFGGSELVVAGKLLDESNFTGTVEASSATGTSLFKFRPIIIPYPPCVFPRHPFPSCPYPPRPYPPLIINVTEHVPSSMERMWAYLTIQQLLEEDQAKDYDHNDKNKTSPEKERAKKLALQYSFVTTLTSLVVVKPNETKAVGTEDASKSQPDFGVANRGSIGTAIGKFASPQFVRGGFAPMALPIPASFGFPGAGRPYYLTTPFPHPPPPPPPPPSIPGTSDLPPVLATSGPMCLATINDVSWLSNDTITLPIGPNGADEALQVAAANETNAEFSTCTTPDGLPGHCRHFRYCVLGTFTSNKDDFVPYSCQISSFAGVCCPDSNPPPCHP